MAHSIAAAGDIVEFLDGATTTRGIVVGVLDTLSVEVAVDLVVPNEGQIRWNRTLSTDAVTILTDVV